MRLARLAAPATLVLALLAAPLATEAQQTPMPEIGFLSSTSSAPYAPFVAAFLEGLKEVGFVEGRNVTIAYRWGDGQFDRLPALADDLVRRQVTVIAVGGGGVTAVAAKKATSTIPIVFAFGSDPIKLGLVASLNRPGGNVTGVTGIAVALGQKRLELLRDLLPDVAVVGFLLNPDSPNTAFDLPEMQAAARALRLIVVNASSEHEINKAFVTLAQRRAAALVVQAEPFLFSRCEQIVALAARHGIPAVYVDRVFPVAGGLMSYGSDFRDVNRQAGIYAGRILKGEKPANLPVVQSIKYELVINLKTAKALGLTIPPSVLARADEVIEERRAFVAGTLALLAAPLAAEAQQAGRVYRIGMLQNAPTAINTPNLAAFRRGLRELGYVEGQNVIIEYRSADGRDERFADLATELVRLNVDLIVTRGTPAALAAKNATGTIPVVMAGIGDPVGQGVVASLARPGGNITGLSGLNTEIFGKRVELLRELLPGAARVAAILNMSNSSHPPQWREVELAARSLGVQPQLLDVRKSDDLPRAFDAAVRQRADALVVGLDGVTQANRHTVVDLAARHRLPTIYASREEFVDVGGLISYGVSFPHLHYRAASFVDRILKGAKPADLPVEQPTKFELVINLKTAKALGLTIPPSVLARADEIIE